MSEAVIFEYPYNLFLKQRLEFVVICQDDLEAKIMRIIEVEMIREKAAWQKRVEVATEAKKTPPREPREYWVRLSQSQIIARLYLYDSAKLTKPECEDLDSKEWAEYRAKKALSISKSTLTKKINGLIDKGFLVMRSKPGDEFGAPIYTLHRANVQKAMKSLPADPFGIFHMGGVSKIESGGVSNSTTGGESQNVGVPVSTSQSGSLNGSESQSQNLGVDIDIDIDNVEDSKEEEGTVASFGNDAAPAPENVIDFKKATDGRLKAVKTGETNVDSSRRGYDVQDHPGDITDWPDSHTDNPTHSHQGQVALQVNSSHSQQAIRNDDDETVPRMEAIKPSQQTSLPVQPAVEYAANSRGASQTPQQDAPGNHLPSTGNVPPMALTARQIKAQAEKREKELWTIIERERHTKYTRTQRTLYDNREGMKCLVEDDITDETLISALQAMDKYQCKNFTVLKFYGWLPNLTAEDNPSPQRNGRANMPTQPVDEDYTDFDKYVGNGKEERAARLKLYEEMKAKGELIS